MSMLSPDHLIARGSRSSKSLTVLVTGLVVSINAYATEESGLDIPLFEEVAMPAGIEHSYDGPWEHFVGGGVAAFDCNNDRFADVFVAGGSNHSAMYINASSTAGDIRFEKADSPITDLKNVIGAYPVNINNDEWMDLVVLRVGRNMLLTGEPDCRFANANQKLLFDGGVEWSTAFSATFSNDDIYPTLAFGNYVDRTAPGSPWGTCSDNLLFRPAVDDNNQVAYPEAIPLDPGHCALSMIFTDWNRSGTDSLRITNDRQYHRGGEEQLWRTSDRYPRLYSRADGWAPLVIWGMGIAEADLNADGYPEYALTSMGDTKLQSVDVAQAVEENRPAYEDIAWDKGATAHRPYTGTDLKPSTGWHAEFADLNNDSLPDLYISKGNVEQMPDFAQYDPDNLLLGTHDDKFEEQGLAAGIALPRRGRGASIVDLNRDGLLDLIVVNRGEPVSVFQHTGYKSDHGPRAGGNWLAVELQQKGGNRHAVGARITVKTGNRVQSKNISVGGGHASGTADFAHFGLGVAERANIRVQWPDEEWSASYRVFANQHVVIKRGDDQVRYWYPIR